MGGVCDDGSGAEEAKGEDARDRKMDQRGQPQCLLGQCRQ